jgi:hypothetical protein
MKLLIIAILALALPLSALGQTKPADNPGLILLEGVVALVVGPFAVMYATGTGVFSSSPAVGYESVCAAVKGKWVNGSCVGGNWLNVIGMAPKA